VIFNVLPNLIGLIDSNSFRNALNDVQQEGKT
jgi:hypothetical protein